MLEKLTKNLNLPSVLCFKTIDSTNKYCIKNIKDLPDKQIVISDIQTAGYGRFNRKWVSTESENIFLSIVLKNFENSQTIKRLSTVTHFVALTICKVFEEYGVYSQIKWPNDVLVENKKIAGILSQSSMRGNKIIGLIVGMGINLNMKEETVKNIDKPATSLNLILKKSVNRDFFLEKLIKKFINEYHLFIKKGFLSIKKNYIKRCNFLGKMIKISNINNSIEGKALDITDNGELVILTNDKRQIVVSGEIL